MGKLKKTFILTCYKVIFDILLRYFFPAWKSLRTGNLPKQRATLTIVGAQESRLRGAPFFRTSYFSEK